MTAVAILGWERPSVRGWWTINLAGVGEHGVVRYGGKVEEERQWKKLGFHHG